MTEFNGSYSKIPAVRGGARFRPVAAWPPVSESAHDYVSAALADGRLCGYAGNVSPDRVALEQRIAGERRYRFGIGVSNGTRALAVAVSAELHARGECWWRGRDTIVFPSFTWVQGTVAGAEEGVLMVTGRRPQLKAFDSRALDWTIDEEAVIAWLREHHERVLVLIVPSLLDTWPRLDKLVPVARELSVPIVHDGAQAGGAVYDGPLADWDTESLQLGKLRGFATGDGGMLMTSDPKRAYLARSITDCANPPGGENDPTGGEGEAIERPWSGQDRLSGLTAAAARGAVDDADSWLNAIRRNRGAIGTELVAPDGTVVFTTPPIQEGRTPTYGWGMLLTEEAQEAYGLTAAHWREVFAAEGFADDRNGYKFGVRQPYGPAHRLAQLAGRVEGDFPRADRIVDRGLMFHVGHLMNSLTAEWLQQTVARAVADVDGLRARFGVTRS